MIRRIALLTCLAFVFMQATSHAADGLKTEYVILVTLDGFRWQDLFGGADEGLLTTDGGVRDVPGTRKRFWKETPDERRQALMPFFWKVIAEQGQVFGDPAHECVARVTNGHNFSYPGYNELLTGAGDERIDSNSKRNNENITVLEWLHRRPGFGGRVAAFCSWDIFPFIINTQRSGVPVNAGWQPLDQGNDSQRLELLNELAGELPHSWPDVRYDAFTFYGALEYLKSRKPRVLYVSLGETDDWAHAGRYDLYLDSAQRSDAYIRRLWETVQGMPAYAGKTSLVLSTDHGRGAGKSDWKSHGKKVVGSDRMWIAVIGPDTFADGLRSKLEVTQGQVASTVAALLGEDFHAVFPRSAAPLPDVIRRSPPADK